MKCNPIKQEIFFNLFNSLCEEMGEVLRLSAYSPNIIERKDFSCALFNKDQELVAQAAHIPVHLGSMSLCVKKTAEQIKSQVSHGRWVHPGDVWISNDPYQGGTHLPDITVISPLFTTDTEPSFYLVTRAHHSDIGGDTPGSMPISDHIEKEGLLIHPTWIKKNGVLEQSNYQKILEHSRTPKEREGDLKAQLAANKLGEKRLLGLLKKYSLEEIHFYMNAILDYGETITRSVIKQIPEGVYAFTDYLDDDGFSTNKIPLSLNLQIKNDELLFDFTSTADQVKGPMNATRAIVWSAVSYVVKCLTTTLAKTQFHSMRPIHLKTRKGSVIDCSYPSPVAGGNVETSQRLVDVILGALALALPEQIPAASCGSMNNLSFGGFDSIRKKAFAYYETIGGGMGARSNQSGLSGVHTHMTNTLNTPIEVLENDLPIRVTRYCLRPPAKSSSDYLGGQGIHREFCFLCEAKVTLLTERRSIPPYGLGGGDRGQTGKNTLWHDHQKTELPSKKTFDVKAGDTLAIFTPSGGAFSL